MDAFQVWHRDGKSLRKVAELLADDLLDVVMLSQNEDCPDDPHEGQRWIDRPEIIVVTDPHPRSTTIGDVILTLEGAEFVVTAGDGGIRFGFQPTDAIREQGYAEWLAEQADSLPEPELTPAGQTRLFQEWRSDAACRELTGKGVDYSDAPYAEPPAQGYAELRAAAAASAKFHRPPGLDALGM